MRTRSEVVTFRYPFTLEGFVEPQPAGTYLMETAEEILPTLLHSAYRRTTTWLTLHSKKGTGTTEMVVVDPVELAAALARDERQAHVRAQ